MEIGIQQEAVRGPVEFAEFWRLAFSCASEMGEVDDMR
jgi:hypothetical protein